MESYCAKTSSASFETQGGGLRALRSSALRADSSAEADRGDRGVRPQWPGNQLITLVLWWPGHACEVNTPIARGTLDVRGCNFRHSLGGGK